MNTTDQNYSVTEEYTPQHRLEITASSVIGTRKYQQDSYGSIETEQGALALICDGMGGLQGGEIASALAVRMMLEDYIRLKTEDIPAFLKRNVCEIDRRVYQLKDEYGRQLGAGSTLAAVHIKDGLMRWISVGDSKIYVFRDNELHCIVREHNYLLMLNELYTSGQITIEQYRHEQSDAEALISYLGMGNVSLMDTEERPLRLLSGDIVLICSDGLYKTLSDRQIEAVIKDNSFAFGRTADVLTQEVMRKVRRSQDNTTVLLLNYI